MKDLNNFLYLSKKKKKNILRKALSIRETCGFVLSLSLSLFSKKLHNNRFNELKEKKQTNLFFYLRKIALNIY